MPASTKTMRICFLYCSCILFFCSAKLHAQKPHLDIKAPYSVSVVGAEQLEARSVTIGNVTELILRLPKTHALVQRNSTYDYSLTGGGQRNDLIYFNREKDPVYLRSVVTDQNAVPILAIEEIRVLKNVESGYKWQNMPGKQYAFQFDAGTKKYKDIAFTGTYKPQFVVPLFADNGEMISNTSWLDKINLMLSKKTFSETKPDDAYGDGGSAIYNYKQFPGFANIETETIQYKDLNGTVREEIYREYYSDGFMYEEITFYDCNGIIEHFDSSMYDDYGDEYEYTEMEYKNGQPVSGYRDIEDEDEFDFYDYREYYNPETDRFERNVLALGDWNRYKAFQYERQSLKVCTNNPRNVIFIGGSLLREDANPGFNLYGGLIDYTRFLDTKIGITGDVRINAGSVGVTDYTKMNFMAGITYVPISKAGLDDCLTFSAHALVGVVNIKSKYGNYSNSQTAFNGVIGPRIDYNFNKQFGVGIQAELNPVFNKGGGGVSYNYGLAAGVRYSF